MNKLISTVFAGFILAACTGTSNSVLSAEEPNILVMGQDDSEGSVSRKSRIFSRVLDQISNEFDMLGFEVYDEIAISVTENFTQNRISRSDAEIIDIAKNVVRPPMDVALIFSIYVYRRALPHVARVKTRITGRLLNIRTGLRLDEFEVETGEKNISLDCLGSCFEETVGAHAKELARDLGDVLANKLDHIVRDYVHKISKLPTAYTLVIRGFDNREVRVIEEFFTSFGGYEDHRPVMKSMKTAEYWYETSSKSGRLLRNLERMLEHMDIKARLTFSKNEFRLERISYRKKLND